MGMSGAAGTLMLQLIADEEEKKQRMSACKETISQCADCIKYMISSNPILLSPVKDDHAIEIMLVSKVLHLNDDNDYLSNWLIELINRVEYAFEQFDNYPSTLTQYFDLTVVSENKDEQFRTTATSSSVLYTVIAIISEFADIPEVKSRLREFIQSKLMHCDMQAWVFSEDSEEAMYIGSENHGNSVSSIDIFSDEVTVSDFFKKEVLGVDQIQMSWSQCGMVLMPLIASRHYRSFVPIELF